MSSKRGGLKSGPLLDIDGILKKHEEGLKGPSEPPRRVRAYAGWSAADFEPRPAPTSARPVVMEGHVPNTTSSRERRANKEAAKTAAKRSGGSGR